MFNIFKKIRKYHSEGPKVVVDSLSSRMSTTIQSDGDVEINGVKYSIAGGSKLEVIDGEVYINGVFQNKIDTTHVENKPYTIEVAVIGNVDNIECSGSVMVAGDCAGSIDCESNATVNGDVNGDVHASGSVAINGSVAGDIHADGSITIEGSVDGNINADGSVRIGGK